MQVRRRLPLLIGELPSHLKMRLLEDEIMYMSIIMHAFFKTILASINVAYKSALLPPRIRHVLPPDDFDVSVQHRLRYTFICLPNVFQGSTQGMRQERQLDGRQLRLEVLRSNIFSIKSAVSQVQSSDRIIDLSTASAQQLEKVYSTYSEVPASAWA